MRFKSQKHLSFIRDKACIVCNTKHAIQAHHLLKPWKGERGMGMKSSDHNVIPLCFTHHHELHNTGDEYKFFEKRGLPENHGKNLARLYWLTSPAFGDDKK